MRRSFLAAAAVLLVAAPASAQTDPRMLGPRTLTPNHVLCTDMPVPARPVPTLFVAGGPPAAGRAGGGPGGGGGGPPGPAGGRGGGGGAPPPTADLRRWILAPLANPPEAAKSRGRIVCTCLNVSESDIAAAIAGGAGFDDLQAKLRCGTTCGSCVPQIRRLVAAGRRAA